MQSPRQETRTDIPEIFPYHCDPLFCSIWAFNYAVSLVELEPSLEELGLVWDFWDSGLRDFKRRVCCCDSVAPELCSSMLVFVKVIEDGGVGNWCW
jgi:hypothetical protein